MILTGVAFGRATERIVAAQRDARRNLTHVTWSRLPVQRIPE